MYNQIDYKQTICEKYLFKMVINAENEDKSAINERFIIIHDYLIKQHKVASSGALFKSMGVPPQYLAGYRKNVRYVSHKVINSLNKLYSVSTKWLMKGEGQMFEDKEMIREEAVLYKNIAREVSLIKVPFIPVTVQASFVESFNQGDNFDHLAEIRYFHVPNPEDFKKSLSFEVEGSSMEPTLYSGDQVLVTPIDGGDWEYASGGVFALIFKDYFVIKRVVNNDLMLSGVLTLHSDNPNGGTLIIKYEDIRAMWKVRLAFKTIK